MSAFKYPSRLPTKPRTEAIEREEYAQAPGPSTSIRRSFAAMVPVPTVTVVDDDDDAFLAFLDDGKPVKPSLAEMEAPVRMYTRKA
ncbi:MAG: hypothetical protein ACOH2M_01315 [Cypionkella sp.]